MIRRARLLLWLAVGIAAIVAAGLWLRAGSTPSVGPEQAPATIGAPFTLTASDGSPFASSRLHGAPYVLFFGFTHCPDVCPTTLARLAKLRGQIGHGDKAFTIVFVSIDPERDTPAEMARYTALFSTPIVGLTGTPAEIDAVKKSFGIYAKKVGQPGGDYTVDHTATVLLFDRDGQFVATISPDEGDSAALGKLRRIAA